jgi:N-carbamoyl-L-amino-acid hydrolase
VEITGFANHAGTTPMPDRRNALLAAAKLIEAVQDEVTREPGRQVGNVGHLEVYPGARNVVPGKTKLTIELRDLDAAKIRVIGDRILARAQAIAAETRTTIDIRPVERDAAAVATPAIQTEIEASAAALGLKSMHLPSGASHDAGNMAVVAPMGMIFVPSVAGVSHSPKELTRWTDCANGANVLLQTVLRLDRA